MSILKSGVPVGLCCDHAGYELKNIIIGYLESQGIAYKDFGTFSDQSCDYADFGLRDSDSGDFAGAVQAPAGGASGRLMGK